MEIANEEVFGPVVGPPMEPSGCRPLKSACHPSCWLATTVVSAAQQVPRKQSLCPLSSRHSSPVFVSTDGPGGHSPPWGWCC
ncbi:MAG: hypothetical protein Q4G49_07540 [Paracoccus sp. (in: a-proteobacteria)]|nr:hypothetical protein [Paracoccus sp. (in: a-proteobacteria)]